MHIRYYPPWLIHFLIPDSLDSGSKCEVHHKVNKSDNSLSAGENFPIADFKSYTNPDLYAMEMELYLASLCEVHDSSADPCQFWMIMLKNGNFDTNTSLCPENGKIVSPIITDRKFPCFGEGCMNQPLVFHNHSKVVSSGDQMASISGSFYGTCDLDADLSKCIGNNFYFSVSWEKNTITGSWTISHILKTSSKYPWLMLYLRADATKGFNGGYHYEGHGIIRKVYSLVESSFSYLPL
ncbi:hypothetical protein GIB67_041255 [Kingdonia uniflora]|uniref:DUF7705 domain-containing protein n=1 Tax=Kingdonia uniflora TaxID=39325 RepID=A0A7J7NJ13_9MAGN|nr:hypothetical protein GIB67_041255 [Kingdonia uniflora]